MFNFAELTPDLILNGLEAIGIRAESGLLPLNSYENRVYQFTDENRQRLVVKFYRPQRWTREQILEEHQFVRQLADVDIPVVAPLILGGQTLHEHCGYLFTLFPSAGGRSYEIDNFDHLESVGRLFGRIHMVGQQQAFYQRPVINFTEFVYTSQTVLATCGFIPAELSAKFHLTVDQLIKALEQYWSEDWAVLRLHGDCHPGNILWRDGPLFVDFDDARNGPAVQDIWMLLHGSRAEQTIQLEIVLDSYNEFNQFDLKQLALIEPLRGMRMLYYLAWIVRRWQDPAFPKSFPWMLDADFWYQQHQLFTKQIENLQAPGLQLMSVY